MISRRRLTGLSLVMGMGLVAIMVSSSAYAANGVLVFGGNRDTGLEIVRALKKKGDSVTVFVRPTSDVAELKALGVSTVTGDALNADDVKNAIAAGKYRAVVSSLGGKRGEPRPDSEGVKNIADGAKSAGVKRVVLVSALGVGDSAGAVTPQVHKILGAIFVEKAKGEDYLRNSGLNYTIVRPGGLTKGLPSGKAELVENPNISSQIDRADLGAVTAAAIDDPNTFNKTLSAIDRELMAAGPLEATPELSKAPPMEK